MFGLLSILYYTIIARHLIRDNDDIQQKQRHAPYTIVIEGKNSLRVYNDFGYKKTQYLDKYDEKMTYKYVHDTRYGTNLGTESIIQSSPVKCRASGPGEKCALN
ncbi:hypothetical protein RF11_07719 [Thelohanellus kitauei]|uniref:Uncharacterized protein n=1 Tax=Thelohanellus kitauei TaxID=669202 RepID=A0A0C2MJG9_THEKT|nr:hypothetical protein RF11_07719 [Thelohanellus kitauei]